MARSIVHDARGAFVCRVPPKVIRNFICTHTSTGSEHKTHPSHNETLSRQPVHSKFLPYLMKKEAKLLPFLLHPIMMPTSSVEFFFCSRSVFRHFLSFVHLSAADSMDPNRIVAHRLHFGGSEKILPRARGWVRQGRCERLSQVNFHTRSQRDILMLKVYIYI